MKRQLFWLSLLSAAALAQPSDFPASSGMAAWGSDRYLIVHDTKQGDAAPRLGVVHTQKGYRYSPLTVDWNLVEGESSDLEAIGPVEGAANQFLACESSYYKGKYGRVFWLDVHEGRPGYALALGKFQLPKFEQEIEGIATRKLDDKHWLVLLGGRGTRDGEVPGRIYWCTLNRTTFAAEWTPEGLHGEEIQLPRRVGKHGRTLSDMYLDEQSMLWVSACVDPGNNGPFRSLIYQAGEVRPGEKIPFVRPREAFGVWWIEGCKVEALGPPPRPGFGPAYATDDEAMGGVWRVVPSDPTP